MKLDFHKITSFHLRLPPPSSHLMDMLGWVIDYTLLIMGVVKRVFGDGMHVCEGPDYKSRYIMYS